MNPERRPEIKPRAPGCLYGAAKAVIGVIKDLGVVIAESLEEKPEVEKPSGWQDPDDDDIQFLHNGAPYNR